MSNKIYLEKYLKDLEEKYKELETVISFIKKELETAHESTHISMDDYTKIDRFRIRTIPEAIHKFLESKNRICTFSEILKGIEEYGIKIKESSLYGTLSRLIKTQKGIESPKYGYWGLTKWNQSPNVDGSF